MKRDRITFVLQVIGVLSSTFFFVDSLPLPLPLPITTEFVPLLDEWASTITPEAETEPIFDDATETATDPSSLKDGGIQFLEDNTLTERSDLPESNSITTDPAAVIVETTIIESDDPNENGAETESVPDTPEPVPATITKEESHQDHVQTQQASPDEEIFHELQSIWNFTNSLRDATESDLKSSLRSLVHFTYNHVIQTPRPETLGRLKDLLRKLRHKLIGEDPQPSHSARQKRSSSGSENETDGGHGRSMVSTKDEEKEDGGQTKSLSLAEDIQELENFLGSPPFSLSLNKIDDGDDKRDESPGLYFQDTIKAQEIDSARPAYNRNPPKYTPPGETVIQKVIHVQDYVGGFPTKRHPTKAPSSSSLFPTSPLATQQKPKPQTSTLTAADTGTGTKTTATATATLPLPIVSSSGLIQQSSITVQNVSGAIIPLSAEQIANSIINLLYQNHTTSSPPSTTASSLPTAPSPAPSFFPPSIQLLGESFHPGSAYLHVGIPQLQQHEHVVNSVYNVIEKEKEDINKIHGSTTFSTAAATTTAASRPKPSESSTPSADHTDDDAGIGNAYDDIKKLIMNLIPTTMSTVLSQNTASIEEYFTTIAPSTAHVSTPVDDSSGLSLYDVLNRIVISSTSEPEPETTSRPSPFPSPSQGATSLEDLLFGIAGVGNRRTTTTTTEAPDAAVPGQGQNNIIRQKLKANSTSVTYTENDSIEIPTNSPSVSGSSTSLMTMIEDISSGMTPLALLNGTKEGIVQVAETFNVLNTQAKIALVFSLAISLLSIILGFFSIGPPIIVVGLLGILIPLALLVLFTWQTNAVKSGKTLLIDTAGLSSISKVPIQDFTFVLKLISDAAQKYKI